MDKSLDEVIKANPKQFSLNRGRQNPRRNNNGGKAAGKPKGGAARPKKNNSPLLTGVSNKNGGRVTKQNNGKQQAGRKAPVGKGKMQKANFNPGQGKVIVDARNKLLAKNRMQITDARDKLAALAKKTDLRSKLSAKRPEPARKAPNLKIRPLMGAIPRHGREPGRSPLSRTIIGRTVENELARFPVGSLTNHYVPQTRYDLPPPPHFFPYHQPEPSYQFQRSSAAMDCEPPMSASKRIRTTEKRLGPREEVKKPEQGHKVYVRNLHHKVTEEDIVELFGDVGPLVRASLERPGIAEVVYNRRDDALRAVDVYHNRQLDGLPMHCSFAAVFEPRRETAPTKQTRTLTGKAQIAPDIGTIHKALFNKSSSNNSQIFTVTLPKKEA